MHNNLIQEGDYWHQTVMLNSELYTMASELGFMLVPWGGGDVFYKTEGERTGRVHTPCKPCPDNAFLVDTQGIKYRLHRKHAYEWKVLRANPEVQRMLNRRV